MARKISAKRRAELINDLINADFELTTLHSKYALSPDSLSQWVQEEDNHRCLAGLCVLADLQTQLLLSRYRLIAAGRLFDLATNQTDDSKAGIDNARRACVDLLKLELKRAELDTDFATNANPTGAGLDSLRQLLYQEPQASSPKPVTPVSPRPESSDD